jgi:hypothetical protein
MRKVCDPDVPGVMLGSSGAISGMIAGLVTSAALGAHAAASGFPASLPFVLMGGSLFGGLAIFLGVSVFLGMVFSYLIGCHVLGEPSQVAGDRAMVAGALYGMGLWGAMNFLILPLVNPELRTYGLSDPVWWWGMHVLFGSALLGTPALRRWLARRKRRAAVPDHRRAA